MKDRFPKTPKEIKRRINPYLMTAALFILGHLAGCGAIETPIPQKPDQTPPTSSPTETITLTAPPTATQAPLEGNVVSDDPEPTPKPTKTPTQTATQTPTETPRSAKPTEVPPSSEVVNKSINLLLIGSSTYDKMKTDGLEKLFPKAIHVEGITRSGATIKVLTQDVKNINTPKPEREKVTEIMIICGINDIVNQGMSPTQALKEVPELIREIREKYPNARISIQGHPPNNMGKDIEQDEFDKLLSEHQTEYGYLFIPIPSDLRKRILEQMEDSLHGGPKARAELAEYLFTYIKSHVNRTSSLDFSFLPTTLSDHWRRIVLNSRQPRQQDFLFV